MYLCCRNLFIMNYLYRREMAFDDCNSSKSALDLQKFMKSQWKNLKMSVLQVSVFAVFWAPYTVHQAWWVHYIDWYRVCLSNLLFA